ncbi:16S rRNA (guanine(527)-N(7))-methyltransferase RsmG [Mycoplasma buteonis]|uniref:16S rRNA (guanine(527)-N(7))-methyltransferase RsmG n=1 Tax=Mycoplasma buteonis TaxID=171280 RepID=UPI00055DA14E|nr:16S rRNA (guanine(527)-N(7))-methyltransferase RsmG [Mycoplasma buteonis]
MKHKLIVEQMCKENNWDFELFEKYVNLIEEKNKIMNLTGFTGDRLWEEGILESLLFMQEITKKQENLEILDIGAGCGFPSIPYVLTKPNNHITIYEPIQKRVNFLNLVIKELNLESFVTVYNERAETQFEKNLFNIVTARAVGNVKTMLMSSFHLVKLQGKMILLKGFNAPKEIEAAKDILSKVKAELNFYPFISQDVERHNYIVEIQKLRSTPKEFPYPWKEIVKQK